MKTRIDSIISAIEQFTEMCGKTISWLVIAMVLLISYDVFMRYVFHQGSIALQELEWHLFALLFLLGGAYTLKQDDHVRVDIIYHSRFVSEYGRAWITLLGCIIFLFPFSLMVVITSWSFAENAFYFNEGSPDPGGLPHRFIIKSAITVGFILIIIQGVAEVLKSIQCLLRHQEPN
ncbi:hypothetical protein LCGC14_0797230 [marine sediment metagenome]|uniref:Tripartite ATP-independent periplasmic transporters DctQ component domain-containing protein n=1 Tax=marine sediment metagenome TaxID=412755 RepID=A0A0F9SAQ3_9ZZZZ